MSVIYCSHDIETRDWQGNVRRPETGECEVCWIFCCPASSSFVSSFSPSPTLSSGPIHHVVLLTCLRRINSKMHVVSALNNDRKVKLVHKPVKYPVRRN